MPDSGNRIIDIRRSGAGTDPLALANTKLHLNIDHTDDDTLLTRLIEECRNAIEKYTSISLTTWTLTVTVDLCEEIELPYGPVNAISSVKVRTGTDSSGVAEYDTLTAANGYTIDGADFKRLCSNRPGRHVIIYTTQAPEEIEDLVLALKNEVAYRYEHKGDEGKQYAAENAGICEAARVLADPYRRLTWL